MESAEKQMRLRYAGTCTRCGTGLPARSDAVYDRVTKTVRCISCAPQESVTPVDEVLTSPAPGTVLGAGVAGSSARREYERRKAKDEERLRAKWGRLGGLAVALSDERQSTQAWARGAVGEEQLGARLDGLASDQIVVLHDRRIPGTRANIDHIAVTSHGVWVIDAKRYKGRPELRIEGGLLRPRVEKLMVGRRDCTKLVDGMVKQTEVVRDVVGAVPVTGALCFVDADWPLLGGAFVTGGVHVMWPKRLAKLLTDSSEGEVDVARTSQLLAERLPLA